MSLTIIQDDITNMRVCAIVNAANAQLRRGGGVCGAIFAAAGIKTMERECARIGGCQTGHAVITRAGELKADYVIHAVGPIWRGGQNGEATLLHDCYTRSLELARKHHCGSMAFPVLSSGIYGYPMDQALIVAVSAIRAFLADHAMDVYLVVYDEKTLRLCQTLFPDETVTD